MPRPRPIGVVPLVELRERRLQAGGDPTLQVPLHGERLVRGAQALHVIVESREEPHLDVKGSYGGVRAAASPSSGNKWGIMRSA